MAEAKRRQASETASAEPPTLMGIPAAESSDPTVHQLLADLDAVRAAGDTTAETRILGRLQTLGYTA